jgi:hypothetical protein
MNVRVLKMTNGADGNRWRKSETKKYIAQLVALHENIEKETQKLNTTLLVFLVVG